MDAVALVSGGKDSIYSILECARRGWRVVALANLLPGGGLQAPDELDSHMLQTVGHAALPAIAACMELPLIRRTTSGLALHSGLDYPSACVPPFDLIAPGGSISTDHHDEVEDLYALLCDVLALHPTITAVSVGAIASSYQRLRVESVCARLQLTPLAFLWQRDQTPLLRDMASAQLDAAIVKVAAFGLTVAMLGASVTSMRDALIEKHVTCGVNVCGEGGEYETLTRFCPGLFLHGRVRFTGVSIVTRSADVYAPVAHLRVEGAVVEALDDTSAACSAAAEVSIKADAASWPSPTLPLRGLRASAAATTTRDVEPMRCDASCDSGASDSSRLRIAGPIAVAGIVARGSCSGCGGKSSACSSVELARTGIASSDAAAEARIVLSRLRCCLRQMGAWLDDVAFVRLYLADMGSFAAVNEVYGEAFNVPAPPARSCVEAASSEPLVSLDAVAVVRGCDCCPSPQASAGARPQCSATPRRMVLHVQSLSAWAPLCIGPYAQAVTMMLTGHGATPRRTDDRGPLAVVLAAGSIGLFPDTMRLVGAAETTTPSALLLRQGQQALLNLTHVLAAAASTDGSVSLTRSLVVTVFIAAGALPPSVGGGTDDEGRITSYSARDAAVRSLYVLVAAWVCGALPRSTASDALSSDSSEDEGEGLDEPSASAEEAPHASAVHRGASFSLEDPCDERRFRLSPSARRLPPYLEQSPSTASMATRAALTAIVDAAVGGGDSSEPESVDAANRAVQAAAYLAPLLPIHVVTVPRLPRGAVVEVEAVAVSEASTTRWRTSTASLTLQSPRGNALHLEAAPYSSDDTVDMQWRQMQRAVRQRGDTDSERVHGEHEAPSPTARPDCACTAKASVSVNCTSHTVVDGAVSSWVTIRVAEAVPDVVGDAPCAQQRAACSAQAPQPSVVAGTVASMLVQAIEAGSTSDATAVTTTIALHELLMRVYVATPAPAAAAGDAWASSFVAALESSIMSRVGEASAVRLSSDASCRKLRVSVVPVCEVSPDVESFARLSANINSASCNDPVDRTSACQGHGTTTDTQQTICHLAVHLVRYVG